MHESICKIAPKILIDTVTPDLDHFLIVDLPSVNTTIAVPYRRPTLQTELINSFLKEFECHCLHKPNTLNMGDFNLNQLNECYRNKFNDLLEMHGFALMNEISQRGITRLSSGTILDLCATNMLQRNHKLSLVHNQASDHSVLFASVSKKVDRLPTVVAKSKLRIDDAVQKV